MNTPLLHLKSLLLASYHISKMILKQDIQTIVLAGHKAVVLPLFECFLVGLILPKIPDALVRNTAQFIKDMIMTLCPRLDVFQKSPGHSDEFYPTPRASRTSSREGTKLDVVDQMKSALDPICQLALYRLIPFFPDESEDFGSSPVSEFYYTLPLALGACTLNFPLPLDIQVDVARAINSICQDSNVVVHEIITIDSPHSFPVGSALFHNGFLLHVSLGAAQLQACVSVCLLWDLFSRTDSAPHFARSCPVWVQGKQEIVTVVADFSLLLCIVLEPLDDKEQIGYDPVYLGKAEKALQILVRYDLHTKVNAELGKLCISPEAPVTDSTPPLSTNRRRYSSGQSDPARLPLSQLSVYSQGQETPIQPMFVKGGDMPLFHFAACSSEGLIYTHIVNASPDWFFYLYRNVMLTYSLFAGAEASDQALRLQVNVTSPYRKQGDTWQLWVAKHHSDAGQLFVCYDDATPRAIKLLAYSLIP